MSVQDVCGGAWFIAAAHMYAKEITNMVASIGASVGREYFVLISALGFIMEEFMSDYCADRQQGTR